MKTVSINLYQFSELSEDAKQKAIEKLYDINVNYEWWDFIYEDAKEIGLNIKEFDIDRGYVKGEFTLAANEVAQNIFNLHGKECETYKTASSFMEEWQPIFNEYIEIEGYELEEELQDIEHEFLQSICEDYRIMLRNEYEYKTSKEAIIEAIQANEYYFTEDGELS